MRARGFIFSLDAFVAFTLISITIGFLIFTISTPKPFYPSLEQAHQLAHDTLSVLATSSPDGGDQTYLEHIISKDGSMPSIMYTVVGGNGSSRGIIPIGYGYRFEIYYFNSGGEEQGHWAPLFDSNSTQYCEETGRCGKSYDKLQASATMFASLYSREPLPGASPYCYVGCSGYNAPASITEQPTYSLICDKVPCDVPKSVGINNATIGENSISLIRLIVYA